MADEEQGTIADASVIADAVTANQEDYHTPRTMQPGYPTFSAEVERMNCERVLGDRRHGLCSLLPARPS